MARMTNILITGGAGFIGSNIANDYLEKGKNVVVIDNLCRKGSINNYTWLKRHKNLTFYKNSIVNKKILAKIIKRHKPDVVFHEAAQTAVTTSLINPWSDFKTNALGTLNVLESIRMYSPNSILVYASTNKVYGNLEDVPVIEKETRYEFAEKNKMGISESYNTDFHSPYGCSKGSADQYVRDYARIFNLKTIVFRQSCIFGPRQTGTEDQGWIAWFIIRVLRNNSLTIFGNGKQVRDILFIDDLIRAYQLAIQNISTTTGKIYNIGGGYKNSISLIETISILEELLHKKIDYKFSNWRAGDQKIYISDNSLITNHIYWEPEIDYKTGMIKFINWLQRDMKWG